MSMHLQCVIEWFNSHSRARFVVAAIIVGALPAMAGCVQSIQSPLPPPTVTPIILAEIPYTTIDAWPPDLDGKFPSFMAEVGLEHPVTDGTGFNFGVLGPKVEAIVNQVDQVETFAALPTDTREAIRAIDFDTYAVIIYWHGGTRPGVWSFIEDILHDTAWNPCLGADVVNA